MRCSVQISWTFYQVHDYPEEDNVGMEQNDNSMKTTGRKANAEKVIRKKATKDDKISLMEEKKKKKEVGSNCPLEFKEKLVNLLN